MPKLLICISFFLMLPHCQKRPSKARQGKSTFFADEKKAPTKTNSLTPAPPSFEDKAAQDPLDIDPPKKESLPEKVTETQTQSNPKFEPDPTPQNNTKPLSPEGREEVASSGEPLEQKALLAPSKEKPLNDPDTQPFLPPSNTPSSKHRSHRESAKSLYGIGKAEYKNRNIPKAKDALLKSCQLGHTQACHRYGWVMQSIGEISSAMSFYRLTCQKGLAKSCNNRALLWERRGNLAFAKEDYEKACKIGHPRACKKAKDIELLAKNPPVKEGVKPLPVASPQVKKELPFTESTIKDQESPRPQKPSSSPLIAH